MDLANGSASFCVETGYNILLMKLSPFAAVFLIHGSMLIAAPALLIFVAPAWSAGIGSMLFKCVGILVAACGAILYFHTIKGLTVPGQGTPAIWDPPRLLVHQGLYRIIRNPMYAAVVLIAAGESLVSNRALMAVYAAALWGGFDLFVRLYEEPTLMGKFGDAYKKYCRSVPRWLPSIPWKKAGDSVSSNRSWR